MHVQRFEKSSFPALCVLLAVLALAGCRPPADGLISYDDLKAIMEDAALMKTLSIIDIRAREAWIAGYIEPALNVPYGDFIGQDRNLIDNGSALTSIMTDKSRKLIIYGSEAEDVELFFEQAVGLGYTDVRYYAEGISGWIEHGNYLVIDYAGFRQWYDAFCPFDDGLNYLISVNTKDGFADIGHIPGATNIVSDYFVTKFGAEPSDVTLQDVVPDLDSKIVFYCYVDT